MASALGLYYNTCRTVLKANREDDSSWAHAYGSLSCLRESLLCYVCDKLIVNPMKSSDGHCAHNICKHCLGGRMRLHQLCIWCMDHKKFVDNVQLRIVLQCYKKMCRYILTWSYMRKCHLKSNFKELSAPVLNFISMVREGANLTDDYHYPNARLNRKIIDNRLKLLSRFEFENMQTLSARRTVYNIELDDIESPKVRIKKTTFKENEISNRDADDSSDSSGFESSNFIEECLSCLNRPQICRCGFDNFGKSKLEKCSSNVCPCFYNSNSCFNCRCVCCSNKEDDIDKGSLPPKKFQKEAAEDMNVGDSAGDLSTSDSEKDPS